MAHISSSLITDVFVFLSHHKELKVRACLLSISTLQNLFISSEKRVELLPNYMTLFLIIIYAASFRGIQCVYISELPKRFPTYSETIRFNRKVHISHHMIKPTKWLCAQRRFRSAWASAQSDQSLCCALNG